MAALRVGVRVAVGARGRVLEPVGDEGDHGFSRRRSLLLIRMVGLLKHSSREELLCHVLEVKNKRHRVVRKLFLSRVFVGGSENSAVSLGFHPFGIILLAALMRFIGRVKSGDAWSLTSRCIWSRF